ncbi:MAG: TonB-dependent receptor [Chitinophagaceae bacterium]|nr:MAG: TonB-dependent receptor [Chitinophagaceae bacterium]
MLMHIPKRLLPIAVLFLFSPNCFSQTDSVQAALLDTVSIRAYLGKQLLETPAALLYISAEQLNRFSNTNIMQALNASPGVRMEERSPGSYRLNIRGSSVRSPFGVRNVKIYYDDIPFTAPGGASMFNMLGFYNVGSLEVIKGPGSSLYGAGTGGVLMVNAPVRQPQPFSVSIMGGSYGLLGAQGSVSLKNNLIRYEHLQSDGYRLHTAMRRDNVSWQSTLQSSRKNNVKLHILYSDLQYETPGALTLNEFNANARAARPATPAFPGAEQAKASIHQQALLAGFTNSYSISGQIKNTTSLYALFNNTKNPTVQNYESKREPHFGGRSVFHYNIAAGPSPFGIAAGGEYQSGSFRYRTYRNDSGKPDTLRIEDKLNIHQYFGFAQLNWNYKHWILTAGASINQMQLDFERTTPAGFIHENKNFGLQFSPRLALLYKIQPTISAYMNIAKGFSPPAADEIFADNNSYNLALAPEKGWNYEPGIRGSLFNKRLAFDASYFITGLENSIVTRRDSGGGNYYVNAGKTRQQGIELSLGYALFKEPLANFYGSSLKTTFSHYRFRYKEFVQGLNDYSGNSMPGVPDNNVNVLADVAMKGGFYINISYSYTDKIYLNDANTAAAEAYHLLSAKAGYKRAIKKIIWSFFAGADNIGDEKYSLGNDVNGFGGRYYNIAPGRSFYAGLSLAL